METIIIHAETEKKEAILTFLEKLKVSFEVKNEKIKEEYLPEFVKTMDKSISQAKSGKLKTMPLDEIWK